MSQMLNSQMINLKLVLNPTAGKGRSKKLLPQVATALLTHPTKVSLQVVETENYAEVTGQCESAIGNYDALLVMGGDGMVQAGLNACANTSTPLGIIPAGTGNDFCRGLGLARKPLLAVQNILSGNKRQVDLMEVSFLAEAGVETGIKRYVGSVLSSGFDARVNLRCNRAPKRFSGLSYVLATFQEIKSYHPTHYRFIADGKEYELDALLVAFGNSGYFGSGMKICPGFDVTDGKLDVTIIRQTDIATLVRMLPSLYRGKFTSHPAVEVFRASEIQLFEPATECLADGELIGASPMKLRAVPNAVTLMG